MRYFIRQTELIFRSVENGLSKKIRFLLFITRRFE